MNYAHGRGHARGGVRDHSLPLRTVHAKFRTCSRVQSFKLNHDIGMTIQFRMLSKTMAKKCTDISSAPKSENGFLVSTKS